MGWKTSALFVRDRTIEEVIGFLPDVFFFEPTGEMVSAEEAWAGLGGPGGSETEEEPRADESGRSSTGALRLRSPSRSRLYLARTGRWCQLWDPDCRFAPRVELMLEDGPRELAGTLALAVRFDSLQSRCSFWLYEDARLVRHASFERGERVAESGTPLPSESGLEGHDDEERLWAVIGAVTGLEQAPEERFAIYAIR